MSWQERVALVTGGSRGIGRAVVLQLSQAGLQVAVNYRQGRDAAEELVAYIREQGGRAAAFAADVADPDQAEHLVEAVQETYGRLDVLVNNAGITRDTLVLRMKRDDWEDVLATDLSGAFYCTKAALRGMVRQRFGRIVYVASVAGLVGNVGQVNYAAAKAGLVGMTKALAKEVASRNITVNAVAPGLIETDLLHDMVEAQRNTLLEHIPLGRLGRPEEIAQAVWYLVQADYVTGHVLVVDGGLAMQ
jgi:3-oxoacyl-[acyl-carrier protein] reductase